LAPRPGLEPGTYGLTDPVGTPRATTIHHRSRSGKVANRRTQGVPFLKFADAAHEVGPVRISCGKFAREILEAFLNLGGAGKAFFI